VTTSYGEYEDETTSVVYASTDPHGAIDAANKYANNRPKSYPYLNWVELAVWQGTHEVLSLDDNYERLLNYL